jgi:hypothetical protein
VEAAEEGEVPEDFAAPQDLGARGPVRPIDGGLLALLQDLEAQDAVRPVEGGLLAVIPNKSLLMIVPR